MSERDTMSLDLDRLLTRLGTRIAKAEAEAELSTQRAEAAEDRVRELEARVREEAEAMVRGSADHEGQ